VLASGPLAIKPIHSLQKNYEISGRVVDLVCRAHDKFIRSRVVFPQEALDVAG
jgi:hypothetical protein